MGLKNVLTKTLNYSINPSDPGKPGVPAIPAKPGAWSSGLYPLTFSDVSGSYPNYVITNPEFLPGAGGAVGGSLGGSLGGGGGGAGGFFSSVNPGSGSASGGNASRKEQECSYISLMPTVYASPQLRSSVPVEMITITRPDGQYGNYNSGSSTSTFYYGCSTWKEEVQIARRKWLPATPYVPALPPVPPTSASITKDLNLGWNAGARSLRTIKRGQGISFQSSVTNGAVVVGLNFLYSEGDYSKTKYPLLLQDNMVLKLEKTHPEPIVTFYADDVFTIKWQGESNKIAVLKGEDQLWEFADEVVPEKLLLDVSMYQGGDSIFNPTVVGEEWEELALIEGELPRLVGVIRDARVVSGSIQGYLPRLHGLILDDDLDDGIVLSYLPNLEGHVVADESAQAGTVSGALPRLRGIAYQGDSMAAALPALKGKTGDVDGLWGLIPKIHGLIGDGKSQYIHSTLPRLSGEISSPQIIPQLAVIHMYANYLSASAVGALGIASGISYTLPSPEVKCSDYDYGLIYAELPPMRSYIEMDNSDEEELRISVAPFQQTQGISESITSMIIKASSDVQLQAIQLSVEHLDIKANAHLLLHAIGECLVDMFVRATGIHALPDPRLESFAWAATEQGGMVTRYSGYNFQSFAEIAGKHYGVRTDGLFLLEGTDDADVPISAEVNFGNMNFSRSELKHLPNVYVGTKATDGRLFLKVETAQGEFTYEARRTDEEMATQRFDLGRGLRDNWFEFTLVAEDVTAFELDNVEFKPVTSKRRI